MYAGTSWERGLRIKQFCYELSPKWKRQADVSGIVSTEGTPRGSFWSRIEGLKRRTGMAGDVERCDMKEVLQLNGEVFFCHCRLC